MNKIAAMIIRHWRPLIIWNLIVIGATAIAITISPRIWNSTTRLTIPETNKNLDANLGILGSLRNSEISSSKNQQIKLQESILKSDILLEKLLEIDPQKSKFSTLKQYKGLFQVSTDETSSIISINVSSPSPELAQQRAINLINLYQKRLNDLRASNRNNRRQATGGELEVAKNKLISAQQELAKFKTSVGLVNAEEQIKLLANTIDTLKKAKSEAETLANYQNNRVATLSSRLRMSPNSAIRSLGLGENQDYQFIKTRLSELNKEITQKRAIFTEKHPSLQKLLQERKVLNNQMRRYVLQAADGMKIDTTVNSQGEGRARLIEQLVLAETEARGQKRRAEQIQSQLAHLQATLKSIPEQQARLIELQQQVDVAEGAYKGLAAQVQQTNIDVFDVYPNVEVIEPARTDPKPVAPKLSLMALNALLGSIIGSVTLLLMLERRNPLLSPQDLQDMKFPIVVSIPQTKITSNQWEEAEASEVKFQRLASAVSLQDLNNRRLLITSAIQGEGKTTVVIGLAQGLVDLGFRVLVVDADFHQAELTRRLTQKQDINITESPIAIKQNLHLLATPPRKGKLVEMVSRGHFQRMLTNAEADGHYDYLLVDTSPVSLTTITALMTRYIPNVLFVVRPGNSYSNSVRDSLEQLTQHRAQILGLVVNGVETAAKPYTYRLHDSLTHQ